MEKKVVCYRVPGVAFFYKFLPDGRSLAVIFGYSASIELRKYQPETDGLEEITEAQFNRGLKIAVSKIAKVL